jgi:hypothetical protein
MGHSLCSQEKASCAAQAPPDKEVPQALVDASILGNQIASSPSKIGSKLAPLLQYQQPDYASTMHISRLSTHKFLAL